MRSFSFLGRFSWYRSNNWLYKCISALVWFHFIGLIITLLSKQASVLAIAYYFEVLATLVWTSFAISLSFHLLIRQPFLWSLLDYFPGRHVTHTGLHHDRDLTAFTNFCISSRLSFREGLSHGRMLLSAVVKFVGSFPAASSTAPLYDSMNENEGISNAATEIRRNQAGRTLDNNIQMAQMGPKAPFPTTMDRCLYDEAKSRPTKTINLHNKHA